MTLGEQERRARPTPLFAGRDALTRRHPIRERPGTDPRASRVAGAAPVPAAARELPSAGRGVARFVAPPTPAQSAPRGAAARRSADTPGHRAQNRYVRKHVIDEMRRPLGHPATAAPRAEAAALARAGHETIQSARSASKSGEAAGQPSTPQEIAKLLLDKSRKPLAVAQRRRAHETSRNGPARSRTDGRCGIARFVYARRLRHAQPTGASRANRLGPPNPAWIAAIASARS